MTLTTQPKERVTAMFSKIVDLVGRTQTPADPEESLRREWDRLREEARTERERAEIDAVFSRNIA